MGGASLDKSVLFPDSKKLDYEYGAGFRDKNTSNLDQGVLKLNENFETDERRKVTGPIAIHVDDILVSGSEMFVEYYTKNGRKFEVDRYGGNESTYLGMEISKVNNEDSD